MTAPGNVLMLMTDQHRVDTLGCYGNEVCRTPNLDALAARGATFDNAFTPSAICTPARASLITGVLPFRHALLANYERNVGYREELGTEFEPFSTQLAAAGYQLGHVGKWHVGKVRGPEDFGFTGTHFPGWANAVRHPVYLSWLQERGLPEYRLQSEVRGTFPNGEPGNLLGGVLDGPVESTFEYFLADRAIAQLSEFAATVRPFYLACNWFGPHLPYCIPAEYYRRYDPADVTLPASIVETFANKPRVQRSYSAHWTFDSIGLDGWRELTAAYWGYVTLIDEQVGRVLGALDELGLTADTLVCFTADHGEFTGSHRLHDKGPAMYDDIYRIPLIVAGPGAAPGTRPQQFVGLTDLTATFIDHAGADVPAHYDGTSLRPILAGAEPAEWRTEIIAEFHGHHFPYPQRMIRTHTHKLVVSPSDRNELYELRTDPDELHNRYDHPELAAVRDSLMAELYRQLQERGDNFFHWMTSMWHVGGKTHDAMLSDLDAAGTQPSGTSNTV